MSRWMPEEGDCYWTIDLGFGTLNVEAYMWEATDSDRRAWALGNCFKWKRHALKAASAIRRTLKGRGDE